MVGKPVYFLLETIKYFPPPSNNWGNNDIKKCDIKKKQGQKVVHKNVS